MEDVYSHLLMLAPEMRLKIYEFCWTREQLCNLSLTCKLIHKEVKPLLWSKVNVKWEDLSGSTDVVRKRTSVQYAEHLTIRLSNSGTYADDELIATEFVDTHANDKMAANFSVLMGNCSPKTVVLHYVPRGGLRAAAGSLENITCLSISIPIATDGWKCLTQLRNLRCLFLEYCNITDDDFEGFENLKKLRVLRINECSEVSGKIFNLVNEAPNIKEVVYASKKSQNDVTLNIPVGKFHDLKSLVIEAKNLQSNFFQNADLSWNWSWLMRRLMIPVYSTLVR